eukprot:188032-Pleurochrysis_carterae.AAC.1
MGRMSLREGRRGGQRRGKGAKRQGGGVPAAMRLALLCSCAGVPAKTASVIQSVWGDSHRNFVRGSTILFQTAHGVEFNLP